MSCNVLISKRLMARSLVNCQVNIYVKKKFKKINAQSQAMALNLIRDFLHLFTRLLNAAVPSGG